MSDGTKICKTCGNSFPATLAYFYKDRQWLRSSCKKCASAESIDYIKANLEQHRKNGQRWRTNNPEKARESDRKSAIGCQERNPNKKREYDRNWRTNNPQRLRVLAQRRKARQRELPATLTHEQWKRCLEWWNNTCAYCGAQQDFWHVLEQEHYVAVTAGGGYTAENIIPACKSCNTSKHNALAQQWLTSRFGKARANRILAEIEKYFASLSPALPTSDGDAS